MKITKQQFDELKNASDLEQVLKAVGIEVESDKFPNNRDAYFYVDTDGDIDELSWRNRYYDQFRQSLGNVHRTEADAEHYKATTLRRWQAEIAIRRWRDEHCPFTPDWTNGHQGKFYGHFNHQTKIWMTTWTKQLQESGTIYFEIADDLRACIDALPDEWNALLID